MIKSKKLKKIKVLKHGFFNSVGGKSTKIYKSLNCGLGSKDNNLNVKKNLEIVRKKISKKAKNIFLIHQIHSNKFVYVNEKYNKKIKPKADAIITNQRFLPIAVLTADCAPILIYDNKINMIAAIHSGWKGAFKGIIDKVINFMIKKGCKLKNMTAVIGPSISVKNYEVREDFRQKFIKKDKNNHKFFKINKQKLYFNLTKYIRSSLQANNIKSIDSIKIDTFDIKNKFFSARRALKLKHNDYGRNISIIMLN
ncbi:peptidoglycan editing factor PgeF [Candidatus Pelagibacter bacterium nBUS_32]|uniref:peptidoglycan editing factor PgeF n=1 Tax=Candidatus Pelagibacter bacterium nBUS_32 TaxID=3374192 RepID=UPI003EBF11DC